MNIAIIGPGFTGACFPLANHLKRNGHSIDCYFFSHIGQKSIESLDFERELSRHDNMLQISRDNTLYNYLDKTIGVFIIPVYKRHYTLEKVGIGYWHRLLNYIRTAKFLRYFKSQHYDRIILIDHFEDEQIGKALLDANMKFVTSFHEVLESLTGKPTLRKRVAESLQLQRPVIIHCNDVKKQLIKLSKDNDLESRISVIRVGAFESLWQYGEGKKVSGVGENFFLFMGRITTYKGLGVLYEAIEKINNNCSVVIAGSGYDPVLEKIKVNNRYHLINRFIENDEMVWLVKNCRAIVCPYISASQSGLMPLAFAFNKPIIATKVGAFPEVIVDGVTGYLADTSTGDGFSEALMRFINDEDSFTGTPVPKDVQWDFITSQIIEILEKL